MQNCKTSARTAVKYGSKSSLLFRPATLAAILMLAAGLFVACSNAYNNPTLPTNNLNIDGRQYQVITIDSCEYIVYGVGMNYSMFSHKGNCKYCLTRKK